MHNLIKKLTNGKQVVFDSGRFDNWCVYIIDENGTRKAPHDVTYFTELQTISLTYLNNKVYNDFLKIYDITDKAIDKKVLELIDEITSSYLPEHKTIVEQWFTVLYAGMIAEENKHKAILKKRIKRLGMHQALVLKMPATEAATFSMGKNWREIDAIMKAVGI
jgi:hypothetical protein